MPMNDGVNLLGLDDIRDAFRLVRELTEIGADTEQWVAHLFAATDRRIGVPVANRMESKPPFSHAPQFVGLMPWGYDESAMRIWEQYWKTGGTSRDSSWAPAVKRSRRSLHCTRKELTDDKAWYRSSSVQGERRSVGIDHFVLSHVVLGGARWSHTMVLYRGWGEKPFSERDLQWVRLVHEELGHLWSSADASGAARAALSPRLRDTLQHLLSGDSEKIIADRLGLSTHTVHDYVKEIYKKLQVSNRGELFAHCRKSEAVRRPRLSLEQCVIE